MARILTDQDKVLRFDEQELDTEEKALARENIGAAAKVTETDEKYFDITDDGMISLKSVYRGANTSVKTDMEYATSNNGLNNAGTFNHLLPENIVIPEIVNGIAVTSYAIGMFRENLRVKSVTLVDGVKTIPKAFCSKCTNLEELIGTENVETIDQAAFNRTRIIKATFPNLKSFVGMNHFGECVNLVIADIGNTVTAIPAGCFNACEKLSVVRNASAVNDIGAQAFFSTLRLKTLSFLADLSHVGSLGLFPSRVSYDWSGLIESNECTFDGYSTLKDINPSELWSGCTTTPCVTPMRSTFNQENPLWAGDQIGDTTRTYSSGCLYVCAAMVYSALMGVDLEKPEDFIDIVRAADTDGTLMSDDIADVSDNYEGLCKWLNAVGLATADGENYSNGMSYTKANLQTMYDKLAEGALVISRCISGYDTTAKEESNHAVVFNGVNEAGELLTVDPNSVAAQVGFSYEAATYPIPIQNRVRFSGDNQDYFVIVTKKTT